MKKIAITILYGLLFLIPADAQARQTPKYFNKNAWEGLTKSMTERQVVQLLGNPKDK